MKTQKSFTLVEVLVGTFLILIVFLGIFAAYQLGLKVAGQAKNKITATAIANGEMEKIRNLSYEVIGTIGGYPEGDLESIKSAIVNDLEYIIETRVDYIVDEADGISLPEDECPNDYKKVEVKASWSGILSGQVKLVTDISPETLAQECSETGGVLLVQVFDAYAIMVNSPLIEIKDVLTDQTIKTSSPIDGTYFFSLAPDTYKVVVSKTNYSGERTYSIEEIADPEKPHPIVLEGELIEISFSIDKLSSLTVETRGIEELEYPLIPNITFNLTGAKLLGFDADEEPVYKYSQNHTTNEEGQIVISGLEWDSYTFSIISPGLDLIEPEEPISLAPDTSENVWLILEAENSLLVTVQDIDTGEPIFSAEVILEGDTQYTNEDGQTYFIPLEATDYFLEASAPGYTTYSGFVSVFGNTFKTINLQRIE